MFPRKICVDVNVYTDRWEFVLLLIPCFLLQEENNEKEKALKLKIEKYVQLQVELQHQLTKLKTEQVSYMLVIAQSNSHHHTA